MVLRIGSFISMDRSPILQSPFTGTLLRISIFGLIEWVGSSVPFVACAGGIGQTVVFGLGPRF